jgi:hypothetical protein
MTLFRSLPVVLLLCSVACGAKESNPVAPTPPPPIVPACEANHTAMVSFGNRSAGTTHTVSWDGIIVATLAPGADSTPFETAAGVAHRLETRITNTNFLACAVSNPILTQCGNQRFTCAF